MHRPTSRQRAASPTGSRRELMQTPAYLVAIANAAHAIGDSALLSVTRKELRVRHGIRIAFDGESMQRTNTAAHASDFADREVSCDA